MNDKDFDVILPEYDGYNYIDPELEINDESEIMINFPSIYDLIGEILEDLINIIDNE